VQLEIFPRSSRIQVQSDAVRLPSRMFCHQWIAGESACLAFLHRQLAAYIHPQAPRIAYPILAKGLQRVQCTREVCPLPVIKGWLQPRTSCISTREEGAGAYPCWSGKVIRMNKNFAVGLNVPTNCKKVSVSRFDHSQDVRKGLLIDTRVAPGIIRNPQAELVTSYVIAASREKQRIKLTLLRVA
jgi:hypothetical protein